MDVISTVSWLPRKYCDSDFFKNYIHNDDPAQEMDVHESDNDEEVREVVEDEFDLDHYDDDDLVPNEQMFTMSSKDEKYIEEDEEDVKARKLEESDRVIIAGVNYEHLSALVVYIYDVNTCGLEPNHTIELGSFPLCSEVIGDSETIPLLAVGTFEPDINIWNISEINLLSPFVTLGGDIEDKTAVLSLSHSQNRKFLLAGGYSDNAVRVWDLNQTSVVQTLNHHTNKVQVVSWNPKDPSLMFTGGFDKVVTLTDLRQSKPGSTFKMEADIECAIWSSDYNTIIGLETGEVLEYDWLAGKEIWKMKSHKKSCTSISKVKDFMVTCGLGSKARVYKLGGEEPKLVEKKNLKAGPLFTSSPSLDDDYLLSFGGNNLVIWDLETIEHLNKV
ncbi:hypothetical protein MACJ_001986 [Theileria orientalis]|uniref:Anaphase-promoting complex subunit 4-like WD40 domain-containing protein n=1 Tax=Theileria orientalis TaxID=68886 RepID=A0A976QV70_THEOR|nr:hypothetical protein MACJ_001986 [Theileria orientalis]